MANIIDYIRWRGDISFSDSPFNEIDALIFSELSYVHFDNLVPEAITARGVRLCSLCEKFFTLNYDQNAKGAVLNTELNVSLLKSAAESHRFSNVLVKGFVNDIDLTEEKQFCAMCFQIDSNTMVVTFRGTDDTIIGWKEDVNMAIFTPIPSQKQGAEYLNNVISSSKAKNIYVCGHSKGGNIATYSALMAKNQDKITAVYSFDSPGFKKEFAELHKNNQIVNRLYKICPENTVVGTIFDSVEKCKYVISSAKGLGQHDGFSWELLGKEFVYAKGQSKSSRDFHNALDSLMIDMSDEEKLQFSDALYSFLTVNGSSTLTEAFSDKFKLFLGVFKTDEQTKKSLFSFVNRVLKEKYFKKGGTKAENAE